jgi:hypothetical protein
MLNVNPLIVYYTQIFDKMRRDKGILYTSQFFKNVYGIAQRFSVGQSFNPIPFTKSNSDGVPNLLEPFRTLLTGNLRDRRSALCVLQIYKFINTINNDVDLSSINKTCPFEKAKIPEEGVNSFFGRIYTKDPSDLNLKIKEAWEHVLEQTFPKEHQQRRLQQISKRSTLHMSSKNGPNGPALETVALDFKALDIKLFKIICRLCLLTNNSKLEMLIQSFYSDPPVVQPEVPLFHSKLSVKQESGGKNRVFAIGDYFSQSVLKGFHIWLFSYLKDLPEDGTHNQNYVSSIARQWSRNEDEIYSIDLTKATDSIESMMMAEIVKQIAGSEFANDWYNLMINRDFATPENGMTRYTTGQPMGFYSSWAMLALWHHMILRTCRHVLNLKVSKDIPQFLIIGDDVAILGKDVADMYHYIVEHICKVPISKLKGFSPETKVKGQNLISRSSLMNSVEIAKRVFLDGHELTPISPILISKALRETSEFPNLIIEMREKGYTLPLGEYTTIQLASLTKQPKLSLTTALFPICSASEEVRITGDGLITWPLSPLVDIIWFKPDVTIDKVNLLFKFYLSKKTKTSIAKFEESTVKFTSGYNQNTYQLWVRGKRVALQSYSQTVLYQLIGREANEKLKVIYSELIRLGLPSFMNKEEISDPRSLRRKLGELQTLIELENIFDKTIYINRSTKQEFASKLISQVCSNLNYYLGLPDDSSDKASLFEKLKTRLYGGVNTIE